MRVDLYIEIIWGSANVKINCEPQSVVHIPFTLHMKKNTKAPGPLALLIVSLRLAEIAVCILKIHSSLSVHPASI